MKFVALQNKDAGGEYVDALLGAGHELVVNDRDADFMLYDCEHAGSVRERISRFTEIKPAFIYPHSPLAYFIWDGHYETLPIKCNFVIGEAAVQSMKAYKYPHRIESVGWTRSPIKPFIPTTGTKLLFVPARTKGNGKYTSKSYEVNTPKAFQFILSDKSWFEKITVCYVKDFVNEEEYANTGIEFIKTTPNKSISPTDEMLRHIENADVVISCETVACLSVATGKPTIVYNAKSIPTTGNIPAKNYELYRKFYEFPLALEDMNIQDVLNVRKQINPTVEQWKKMNIGEPFNKLKFISIVEEGIR